MFCRMASTRGRKRIMEYDRISHNKSFLMCNNFSLSPASRLNSGGKGKKRSEQRKKKTARKGNRVVVPGPRLVPFIFIQIIEY